MYVAPLGLFALVALIITILIGYTFWGHRADSAAAEKPVLQLYISGESLDGIDAALLSLDRQSLDDAYRAQLQKLFSVWVSQQAGDARAISAGLQIARRAYRQAAAQIAAREQQLRDR